jgi:hypothetical protein
MLNFAHGSIQSLTTDPVSTTYTVVTNFQPKAIRFYWVGLQSNPPTPASSQTVAERRGVGFWSSTTGNNFSVGTFSADNSGNADCGSIYIENGVVVTVDGTGTLDGRISVNSSSATGFILILNDVLPANITIFYEVWGGDEITDVTVGSIAEPAATGNNSYAAGGFLSTDTNNCIMFAGVQSVNAAGTGQAQDSGLHIGFATGTATTNQVTVCGNSDDGSATMDTDGYNRTGECLSMIVIAGGNPNARAVLTVFSDNAFTLNWLARATTNRRSMYMAIRGGQWQAGSTTIAGNTLNSTATIGDVPFNIRGVSLIGAMKTQSTINTSTAQDRIGFGSGLSTTSLNSAGVLDEDATANSEIDTIVTYTSVLAYPSITGTTQTSYNINNLNANSLTLVTTTAGGVANEWIGYLIFGDKKPRTISVGHPFIN